jgi:sporulation protein YlmC with PRC-barrel domain
MPAAALSATEWTFKDIDADGNLEVTEKEFESVSGQAFSAWDADADQRIARDELERGMYHAWDADRNGQLAEAEFNEGYLGWFGGNPQASFSGYDTDRNGSLAEAEFSTALDQAGAIDGWNVEGEGLDLAAFHSRLYEAYDGDRNDRLAEAEYSRFGDDALVGGETTAAVNQQPIQANEIVRIADWDEEKLYAGGISVERMMDDFEVYGAGGEEIGDIENVVFSREGRVLSIIAEVGGLWDIGDTHVNIPWDQVDLTTAGQVVVPVTEDNVEDYSFAATDYLTAFEAAGDVQVVDDDLATGPRAFRATELIGDYARIKDGDGVANYGYVNDLIVRGDQLQAVVVNPDAGYGARGAYAYPYYGLGLGYGSYYDMPYERDEALRAEPLEYDRFAAAD